LWLSEETPTTMTRAPATIAALRQVLADRFPSTEPASVAGDVLPTGWTFLDELGGGLPKGALTELTCTAPSGGFQLLLGLLLREMRAQNQRVALVDAADGFDPGSWPADWLEHLVWVRAQGLPQAMQVADLLARDANFGLLVLDLSRTSPRELNRLPSAQWYRLQRAVEHTGAPLLVATPASVVPSAGLRLNLERSHALESMQEPRLALAAGLPATVQRQRRQAAFA